LASKRRNKTIAPYALQRANPCKTRLRFVHVAHAIACAMAIHRLYGELAASLVRATTDCWAPGAAPARAGADLHDLCVAHHEYGSPCAKLLIDGSQVVQFVMDCSMAGQIQLPSIDEVFAVWIWCATHWDHASVQRVPFVPHDNIQPVMVELIKLGYAEPFGGSVFWTDKIGPAMRMSGNWNEHNISYQEVREREDDLEMREALASIPEDVRHSALRGDRTAVGKALAARWVDGAWLPDTVDEAPWWRLMAVAAEAKRLVELIEGTDDPLTRDVN
jgi:hypothetical protein